MASSSTPPTGRSRPRFGLGADGTSTPLVLLVKIVGLALVAAIAVWAAAPLIRTDNWWGLAILVAVTLLAFYVSLSPRPVPLKYLLPGTLFLIAFQIVPVAYTITTAFTNFGDGHRGTKEQAITAIEGASVKQVPDSTIYVLTLATVPDTAAALSPVLDGPVGLPAIGLLLVAGLALMPRRTPAWWQHGAGPTMAHPGDHDDH